MDIGALVQAVSSRWPLGISGIAVSIFCFLSYGSIDRPLAAYCKLHLAVTTEGFFKTVTDLGNSTVWLIPGAVAWLYCRWRLRIASSEERRTYFRQLGHAALYFVLNIAASGLFVDAVKAIIGRSRPRLLFEQSLYTFHPFTIGWAWNSFPSGHSQSIFAAMMALVFILPRYDVMWLLIAVLVAASRVITTVHFLSDITMGAYIGIIGAILMRRVFQARKIDVRLRFTRDRFLTD